MKQLDLFGRELLAVDGTRIKAVNNKDRNFTRASLAEFIRLADAKLNDYLQRLDSGDATEATTAGSRVKNLAKKISATERLWTYLRSPRPAWPEIVDAADWLRGELEISKSLWGEACLAMGREQAAVAIAIVSAKPAAHFRSTPGGYFHGMVTKAKTGELNLARTIWGLRQHAITRR